MSAGFRLAWKEYRQQLSFWLAIVVLAVFAALVCMASVPDGSFAVGSDRFLRDVFRVIMWILAATGGVVAGALLFAGEKETRTTWFLDLLPTRRTTIWLGKVLAGFGLTLLQVLVLCLIWMIASSRAWSQPWSFATVAQWEQEFLEALNAQGIILIALGSLAIEGFVWATLASTLTRTVMAAVGLTIVFSMVAWLMYLATTFEQEAYLYVVPRVILWSLALGVSAWVYWAPTRERATPVGRVPSSFQSLLWLSWRQSYVLWYTLLVTSLATSVVVAFAGIVAWPIASLLVGVIGGLHVFQSDQTNDRFRFLGDQRFPMTCVWLLKVFLGLVAVCVSLVVMRLMALAIMVGRSHEEPNFQITAPDWNAFLIEEQFVPELIPMIQFLPVWATYGFSVGLLCGQMFQKPIVSSIVAQGISVLLLLLWIPLIVCGGLPTWQLYVVPVVFLTTSWLHMRSWISGRSHEFWPCMRFIGTGVFVALWMFVVLGYRSAEFPDMEVPFDMNRYLATIPRGANNKAGNDIVAALKKLDNRYQFVEKKLHPNRKPGDEIPEGEYEPDLVGKLIWDAKKLKKKEVEAIWKRLDPWTDEMFAGEWDEELTKACREPLGAILNLEKTQGTTHTFEFLIGLAKDAFLCRSLQEQRKGNLSQASEALLTAFRLVRHPRPFNDLFIQRWCNGKEQTCLAVLRQQMRKVEKLPKHERTTILNKLLKTLKTQDKSLPSTVAAYKAELREYWSSIRRYRSNRTPNAADRILATCVLMPWEAERVVRMQRIALHAQLWLAEQNAWELPAEPERGEPGYWLWEAGLTTPGSPATQFSKEIWMEWKKRYYDREIHSAVRGVPFYVELHTRIKQRAKQVLDLRTAQLQVAQRLYFAETGQRTNESKDLVPRYFTGVPQNPVTGEAMTLIPAVMR
ncbi:MAG: ABC transporter permease [Gemmataceae bacterium]